MAAPDLVAIGSSLIVSITAPFAIRPLLAKMKVIDFPNERSSHSDPVLRGAGLAPLLGFLIGVAVLATTGGSQMPHLLVIGVTGAAVGALGLLEDLRGVRIVVRAGAQMVLGAGATFALVWIFQADLWWVPVGALLFAGYTNAANFMDGINGISSLHGTTVGSIFAIIGLLTDQPWLIGVGLVLAVAFLAFLPWNLARQRMFLGDVGSYLLGGAIGTIVIAAVLNGTPTIAVLAPLGIYLADTTSTLVRRVLRGEEWQQAHRSHTYQKLTDAGLPHLVVAVIVTAATLATGALGLLSLFHSIAVSAAAIVGIILVAVGYLSLPRLLAAKASDNEASYEATTVPAALPAPPVGHSSLRWVVIGGTGFIGSSLIEGLRQQGVHAVSVTAPRLRLNPNVTTPEAKARLRENQESIVSLADTLRDFDVVVNAAGLASPDARGGEALFGANALLPAAVLRAAELAQVHRMIHISSAAVQGRREVLDETTATSPFSPYSESKALGESLLLDCFSESGNTEVVIVRATSVQGEGRATTGRLRRLAQSRAASVARPGDRPTVVSSVRGLVEFLASVGCFPTPVPTIVLQPWEGMTTSSVLEIAGGRVPMRLPELFCRALIAVGYAVGAVASPVNGLVRRIELMWLGQDQKAAWAQSVGLEKNSHIAEVFSGASVRLH
ncbi:NAD-dependent epimerase/dehydratase family protein [Cryobacterium sp. PH31-AA6]|uniref:NAD-dependent epimerase/dehydratase family protein n=1 Tax=Cryobacterium sp. PH31-AA6 TaxID=3046205 RepID=UPI0024BBD366|nr:NAD-dependent epimerase/dehydratase family protein [Cryobacterium sp. PH31-AA6]MDJ0323901.1 NAD-dependent epimerase/dehydratase family protein [Cryobacterium sp. PH31-AA6]